MQNLGTREIETKRLLLRRFRKEDAGEMYRNWANDDSVTKYMRWNTHTGVAETEEVLSRWLEAQEKPDTYHWGISLKDGGALIGSIGADLRQLDDSAEVGYCIGRAYWRNGYTAEALRGIIEYLFLRVGVNRIEAYHSVDNPASGRVMEKAGMRYEGFARQKYRCRLGYQDSKLYGVLRSDIEELKLILPDAAYKQQYAEMVEEFQSKDQKITPAALTCGKDDFEEVLRTAENYRNGIVPDGHVPSTVYWLLRLPDNRLIGAVDIRHRLNEHLREVGGNIGYGIRPSERRKGYAVKQLALALDKCREMGMAEAVVSCDTDNTGSAKTIRKNGGILDGEGNDGVPYQRYKIKL